MKCVDGMAFWHAVDGWLGTKGECVSLGKGGWGLGFGEGPKCWGGRVGVLLRGWVCGEVRS